MSLSDDQLARLEAFVDGELPATDEDALRQRIETEPTLSAALEVENAALRQQLAALSPAG